MVEPAGFMRVLGIVFPTGIHWRRRTVHARLTQHQVRCRVASAQEKSLTLGADHAAGRTIGCFEVGLIQEPDSFPDLGDLAEVFGREDQLAGPNVRLRRKDRDDE